jgi:uncharacterized membrane protein YedE/YeeE
MPLAYGVFLWCTTRHRLQTDYNYNYNYNYNDFPMNIDAISHLQTQVLWASFAVSIAFGWVSQRSHFCTMGAFSDIVNMGDWTRMRMWALAAGVAILGFYGLAFFELINPSDSIHANGRVIWLSALVGGAMFGFGMVLASGCGSKTLLRIGAGSLKSLVVFVFMGLFAFMTLRGITAVARTYSVDLVNFQMDTALLPYWLASQLGAQANTVGMLSALVVGGGLVLWALKGEGFIRSGSLLGGLGVGACIVAIWWVSGHLGFVPEHPETLEATYLVTNSASMESLTFTAPLAYVINWLIYFSDVSCVRLAQQNISLGWLFKYPRYRLAYGWWRTDGRWRCNCNGLHHRPRPVWFVNAKSHQSVCCCWHHMWCLSRF